MIFIINDCTDHIMETTKLLRPSGVFAKQTFLREINGENYCLFLVMKVLTQPNKPTKQTKKIVTIVNERKKEK